MKARASSLASVTMAVLIWSVLAAASETTVVDTGQTSCYGNLSEITCPRAGEPFSGQDAQHEGNAPAYRDNGDGTVTDLNTGIMWQQGFAEAKLTFAEAKGYVSTMNAQRFAGYNDWRLPTIKQLYSLIDFRGTDPPPDGMSTAGLVPFVDTDFFDFAYGDLGAGERIIDSQWITSTLYAANDNQVFGLNLADGRIKGYGMTSPDPLRGEKTFYVRLCRGNPGYGQSSLVDNGDGTVTDEATGLMWMRSDSGRGMSWEDALAWAAQKNAESSLGHSDWRVPNAKELQSIVDYTRSPETTGSAAIDPAFDASAITNEAGEVDFPFYWSSTTFLRGDGSAGAAVYVAFGRGLGYMNGHFVDVHGAGCQRSDPKDGDPGDFPRWGFGPQGDVQRVFNHVRLVRDAEGGSTAEASYVYWVEIAARLDSGNGGRWLTDLAVRNLSASDAEIGIVLHGSDGSQTLAASVPGSAQAVYEDVVGLLGVDDKGALEIRSDQPLIAVARIYNQTGQGTFGQLVEARESAEGLSAGEGAWLLGLRQLEGLFRTNISVTNTGAETATVEVRLHASDGTLLHDYNLRVEPAEVVQDLEPFSTRAGHSQLGWGFARVNVVTGAGVLSSASVIDSRTWDATTISMTG